MYLFQVKTDPIALVNEHFYKVSKILEDNTNNISLVKNIST